MQIEGHSSAHSALSPCSGPQSLVAIDVEFKVLGADLLIGAVGADSGNGFVELLDQILIFFGNRNAGTLAIVFDIAITRYDKFPVIALVGAEKGVLQRHGVGEQ